MTTIMETHQLHGHAPALREAAEVHLRSSNNPIIVESRIKEFRMSRCWPNGVLYPSS